MRRLILVCFFLAETCLAQGIIRTVAGGGAGGVGGGGVGDGGRATAANLSIPNGLVLDELGNLLVADTFNHRIRKVTPGGLISTVAGNGIQGFSGDGGLATAARLQFPSSVALDRDGNLYILDAGNFRVRRVTRAGIISTVAGTGTAGFSGDNGQATQAQIFPATRASGIVLDAQGNLYITDTSNQRIRRVTPSGVITTVAGNGRAEFSGDNGPARAAALNNPNGTVAIDRDGNIFIPDTGNNRVRRVNAANGVITTIAGTGTAGFSGDGGPATQASLRGVLGVLLDPPALYIIDRENDRVRRVTVGVITTVAGGGSAFPGDLGLSTDARMAQPSGLAVDSFGNLYMADTNNHLVRKVFGLRARPGMVGFSPSSQTFTAAAGGDAPDPQVVVLGSRDLLPFAFGARAITTSGGNWLRIRPTFGQLPTGMHVSVDTTGLPAGTYEGTINIAVAQATNSPLLIPVRLEVTTVAASLGVAPDVLRFSAVQGGANPRGPLLRIQNRGGGSLNWTALVRTLNGGNWLSLAPGSGTAPGATLVTASIAGLRPGLYQGVINVQSPTTGQTDRVGVLLQVSSRGNILQASQSGVTFFALEGAGALPPQSFNVINGGMGTLSWTAQVLNSTGGTWLTIAPTSGASDAALAPPAITLSANATGLTAGNYHARIRLDSSGAANTPVFVSAVLSVLSAGSLTPLLPSPSGLFFQASAGGPPPAPQNLQVFTGAATTANFTAASAEVDGEDWLKVSPPLGSASATTPATLTVLVDSGALPAGSYSGSVTVSLADGATRTINVLLVVTPPGTAAVSRHNVESGGAAESVCTASKLLPVHTGLVNNFLTSVGWPTSLVVRVTDDCGANVTTATVVTSFSTGEPSLTMQNLKNGQYSATWTPASPNSQVTLTSTALASGLQSGSARISGGASTNAVPLVFRNGAVHAASFAPRAPLSPGSIISIFGSLLSSSDAQARDIPLPNTLGNVSATLGGLNVPLYFASAGQVNAQVPFGLTAGDTAQLTLNVGGQFTVPESITISAAQPGVFTLTQTGSGPGAILDVNFQLVSSTNPVKPGDVIQVFVPGLGATDPAVSSGARSPSDPLARALEPVTAKVEGMAATVHFAGLAPGFVGLYQVNFSIPEGVRDGEVQVVLTQDGVDGNTTTIQVRK